jgi:hypothetical protein
MNTASPATASLDLGLEWQQLLCRTGRRLSTRLAPTPLPAPYWVGRSEAVAHELGLAAPTMASAELLDA